eukprot:g57032.t1
MKEKFSRVESIDNGGADHYDSLFIDGKTVSRTALSNWTLASGSSDSASADEVALFIDGKTVSRTVLSNWGFIGSGTANRDDLVTAGKLGGRSGQLRAPG